MAHNKTTRNALTVAIVGLIGLSVAFQEARISDLDRSQAQASNSSEEGQDDLSSLASSTAKRTTELGQATKGSPAKQLDVILGIADQATLQKYDLKMTSAQMAWSRHRVIGNKSEKICVIDTGVDEKHPNLVNNLWINPGESCLNPKSKEYEVCEKSRNGIDDDGDGFIDDVHGWNFVGNNNSLKDNHGHGTHIAGIIAADGRKNNGIIGMAPGASLIIAKYYDPQAPPSNNLVNTVRAIRYCTQMGATIINYSGGGLEPSDKEREAIRDAKDQNGKPILFIAAAGNERSNSDVKKYYPADYDLPNIISVTATDEENNVLDSSNYGEWSVDIPAPGKKIYSTLPNGGYGFMTGTSQATAVVTGAAALIRSKFPDQSAEQVIQMLTASGDFDPAKLKGKTSNQKHLNIYRALAIVGTDTNVSGIIPRNTAQMKASSFSIGQQDTETTQRMISNSDEDQLAAFIRDSKKALEKDASKIDRN